MPKVVAIASALLLGIGMLGFQASAAEPTVESVMEAHITAIGGMDAYKKVTALKRSGDASMSGAFGDMSGTFVDTLVVGKKFHTVTDGDQFDIKQGWNGTAGWSEDNMQGLRDLEGDELGILMAQSEIDQLVASWVSAGKESVKLLPEETIDGVAYHVLQIAGADEVKYYIDKTSNQLSGISIKYNDPNLGESIIGIKLSDYAAHEGLQLPGKNVFDIADGIMVFTFVYITTEINPAIDEKIFEKP